MIDGINISVYLPSDTKIKDWDCWETLVNAKTLRRVTDKYTAKLRGLDLTLTDRADGGHRLNIKGSLHKFLNAGSHNAGCFSFMDLIQSIDSLKDITGISPELFEIHGLEIGINIPLSFSPAKILRNLVSYGNKPFDYINAKRVKLGFAVALRQYEVKAYDKGAQSGTGGNVLRFELAFKKMQPLEKYGLHTLADLTNPGKIYPLHSVLLEALNKIIWTDRAADLDGLTDRQQKQFLFYSNPKSWADMNKDRKKYHLRKWKVLINQTGKVYDLRPDILTAWQDLFKEMKAHFLPPFYQIRNEKKAHKITTFLPLECQVKKWGKSEVETVSKHVTKYNNIKRSKKVEMTKRRFCASCGNDISHQSKKSRFCSARFVGEEKARQCRNKDSNRRLSIKRKIKRAMKENYLMKITYKDTDGETYTDTLHAKELYVTRKWLDSVLTIERMHPETNKPETLKGSKAKEYLKSVTKIHHS